MQGLASFHFLKSPFGLEQDYILCLKFVRQLMMMNCVSYVEN